MTRYLIDGANIFDGTGTPLYPGKVLVEGNRITAVAGPGEHLSAEGAQRIDGRGATLLPGLIDAHCHLSFGSTVHRVLRRGRLDTAPLTLAMVHAARTMLDFGFTGAYSGGTHDPHCEVSLRDDIAAGLIPGPRLRASSFERSATLQVVGSDPGAFAGIASRQPDPDGVRDFVNRMADIGVDAVKFVVTGESGVVPGTSRTLQFYDEELAAAAAAAQSRQIWLTAHVHSAESIKMALRHGFRVLYHCTWADEEAIDMLEAKKDEIFVAPAPGINWANIHDGGDFGITKEMAERQEQFVTLERVSQVMPELHKRGVRVLPGGDYGFPWNPIGKNARDLELFVKLFGFSAAEVLRAATLYGGQILGLGHELGLIKAGYLADLLLLEGDPLQDIRLFQDERNFSLIMQDGRVHKHLDRRGS